MALDTEIVDWVNGQIQKDSDRNDDFAAYDAIDAMEYELPPDFKKLDWARLHRDSLGHDALRQASNIVETKQPKFDILPLTPDDTERAKKLEQWLEWQWARVNMRSGENPGRTVLRHALKYDMIACQVDYLPYWINKGNTKYQKEALRFGAYCITHFNPSCVHYETGRYGLIKVAVVTNILASEAIGYWNAYTDKNSIKKLRELVDEDPEAHVVMVDYTDHDRRYVFCTPARADTVDVDTDGAIVILDEKNELGFINWVIENGGTQPILSPLHKANLYSNICLYGSLLQSGVMKSYGVADFITVSLDGEPKDIQYGGLTNQLLLKPGESVTPMPLKMLDPALLELFNQTRAMAYQSTGLGALQNLGSPSNVQFATYNMMYKLAISMIEPSLRLSEKALCGIAYQFFRWVEATGGTVKAFNTKPSKIMPLGAQIDITPTDFDFANLYIIASLTPNSPTDQMQQINMYMTAKREGLPLPNSEILELMKWSNNTDVTIGQWEEEQIRTMALTNFNDELKMKMQMQAQAATMQMQAAQQQQMQAQQAQQQPQPNQTPASAPSFQTASGSANDPNQGGNSPYQSAPQLTQTSQGG